MKPQDLDNSIRSLIIRTDDPLPSMENATLKVRTVFCSSGAVKKIIIHTFVVHSNLNFQMNCESSRSTTNKTHYILGAKTHYIPRI